MSRPPLDELHQELQTAFFQQRDQELLEYLRSTRDDDSGADQLQTATGIQDPQVLAALRRVGINAESITAFTLLPLVRVAWADSKIQDGEFESILNAARSDGLDPGSVGYRLLNRWMEERPSEEMLIAWRRYAQALTDELDDASLEALRQATLGRAYRVAEASGGFLGLGSKISNAERLALEDLAHAFEKPRELL